jgi:DNA-binding transcriptional regulator YbjK
MRIAAAAIDVVAKWGVEGLTHRRVAAAARVPLGSMTYHFSSLDDLLVVASELAAMRNREAWRQWRESLPPRPDLAAELTTLLIEVFSTKERNRSIVQIELYLAAMRRATLRKISVAWGRVVFDTLIQLTDPTTAHALSLMLDSLAVEALVAGEPPAREECLMMFSRALPTAVIRKCLKS